MVGGAPGLGGGPTQPPTQYETETQAYNEVTKKYVLGMVWDSIKEAIPFTQQEYDEVFQYKAEAERPTLHPLLHLRGSELESLTIDDETWKPAFQELFESLPRAFQELSASLPKTARELCKSCPRDFPDKSLLHE